MPNQYIVTLDFGSTSAKCLIFDTRGKKVAQVKHKWNFANSDRNLSDRPGFSGESAWKQISNCCREALQISKVPLNEIACVIPTSQRHGAVILNQENDFLFSFTNSDERSAPPWPEIAEKYGEIIFKETGRWPHPVFLPAHLYWLKQEHPEIYGQISKILGIQDWIIFQLSGEIVSERTVAGDLLLMDVHTGEWSLPAVELFGLNISNLPPIVDAGTPVGKISPQAAEDTGLLTGTPVLNGAADSQLAMLGTGAVNPTDTAIIFGTSIPMLYLLESPCFHHDGATWTNSHVIPGQWVLESNSGDVGLCLNLFRSKLLPYLSDLVPPQEPENLPSLFELDELAEKLNPRRTRLTASWGPVIFHGRDWPEVNGLVEGINLLGNHSVGWVDLYFSLVENSALAILGNYKQLVDTAGLKPQRIFLGGPAVESNLWQQILADVLDNQVIVPEEKEITPLGAAVLAATQLGFYSDIPSAVKGMVRNSNIAPRGGMVKFYKERYPEWLEIYQYSLK